MFAGESEGKLILEGAKIGAEHSSFRTNTKL